MRLCHASPLPLWERASGRDLAAKLVSRVAGRVRGDSFPTRLRRLPLTARASASVLPPCGGAGRHRYDQTCALLSATLSVRGLLILPLAERGMARRKAQTYGSAILLGSRRAPLGAPVADVSGTGPRFRRVGLNLPTCISQLLAGTPSGPGGSPAPPRVLGLRKPSPQGHRTSSRIATPRESAPQANEVGAV